MLMILDVAGELIRANVTDGQQGVPLYADFQVLDVATCEPVTGLYLDFWHGEWYHEEDGQFRAGLTHS